MAAGRVVGGIGARAGLTLFDATRDPDAPKFGVPRAQFTKLVGTLGVARTFEGLGRAEIDLLGQWSEHPLYADDQLTLGSSTTIRGFTNRAAKVDRGLLLRSEFAVAIPADWLGAVPVIPSLLTGAEPYVFSDAGLGRDIANALDISRASLGIGLRYRSGRLSFDISVAAPIHESGLPSRAEERSGAEYYMTLSLKTL